MQAEVLSLPLAALQPIVLKRVRTPADQALWRDLVARHHYLGHRVPFGAPIRYRIEVAAGA